MFARRMLIVLAVVMALTALAAGVAPREPVVRDDGAAPPASPVATPESVERTLDAAAQDQRVVARVGQTVVITVEGAELDTVSLAEFGNETVEPVSPARFELRADVPGTYAIDLLEAERRIGTLVIRPAAGPPGPAGSPA